MVVEYPGINHLKIKSVAYMTAAWESGLCALPNSKRSCSRDAVDECIDNCVANAFVTE